MEDCAATLHAPIVAAPDDLAVDHEHRSNRNSTLRESRAGFLDGSVEKRVSHLSLTPPFRFGVHRSTIRTFQPFPRTSCFVSESYPFLRSPPLSPLSLGSNRPAILRPRSIPILAR